MSKKLQGYTIIQHRLVGENFKDVVYRLCVRISPRDLKKLNSKANKPVGLNAKTPLFRVRPWISTVDLRQLNKLSKLTRQSVSRLAAEALHDGIGVVTGPGSVTGLASKALHEGLNGKA